MRWWLPLLRADALLRGPVLHALPALPVDELESAIAGQLDNYEASEKQEKELGVIPTVNAWVDDWKSRSAVAPVLERLEQMLRQAQELLRYEQSDARGRLCTELATEAAGLDALPHAHEDPHRWAIRQVEGELAYLCTEWPIVMAPQHWDHAQQMPGRTTIRFRDSDLQEHLDALRTTLATYEQRLQCAPGAVPCGQGGVTRGQVGSCVCACQPGWVGETCAVALCAGCDAGACTAPDRCECHDPVGVTGAACNVTLQFTWAVEDWGLCPGKGRDAEAQREVSCVRSDGAEMPDSECERRVGAAPARVQDCCDPFSREELPYTQCGLVDAGCGGQVDFGDCEALLGHGVALDSPFYPVISRLKQLLGATQAVLHHGSEERAAACASMHGAYRGTDNKEHFAASPHSDADEWALHQVEIELAWLCGRRETPFADGEVEQHLHGVREVYDAYLLRVACQPGDAPCVHGDTGGVHGACTCACHAGYKGTDCSAGA